MCFRYQKVLPLQWRPGAVQSMQLIGATEADGEYIRLQIAAWNF